MKSYFLLLTITLFLVSNLPAQGVGIGTTLPNTSAMLDITSTSRGFLMPRLTTAQRTRIVSPSKGLLVYDSTTNSVWYHDGNSWGELSSATAGLWKLNGTHIYNSNSGNVGIGTTSPPSPLSFGSFLGEKISLASFPDGNKIGMGIQNSLFQIYSDFNGADIAFGYGNSNTFTENMRIKGTGNVGIGTSNPVAPLSFNNLLGRKLSFVSFPNGTDMGIGFQNALLQMYTDFSGADIAFGYGTSNAFTENVRIKGTGNLGIGTSNPTAPLSFSSLPGRKVSFASFPSGNEVGIGLQNALFQLYTDVSGSDIAFGYGNSNAFTENVRIKGNGNVGIGTSSPFEKLSVNGNICYTGSLFACSDIRYKTNFFPVTNALSTIINLHPIYYNWKKEFKDKGFTEARQIGFSAQEVEGYFPEMVQTNSDGYKAIDYSRMTPILVEAIKELKHENDEFKKKNELLEARLDKLERLISGQR